MLYHYNDMLVYDKDYKSVSKVFGSILKIACFFEIIFSLTISTAILTEDFANFNHNAKSI